MDKHEEGHWCQRPDHAGGDWRPRLPWLGILCLRVTYSRNGVHGSNEEMHRESITATWAVGNTFPDFTALSVCWVGGEGRWENDEFHVSVPLDIQASCSQRYSLPPTLISPTFSPSPSWEWFLQASGQKRRKVTCVVTSAAFQAQDQPSACPGCPAPTLPQSRLSFCSVQPSACLFFLLCKLFETGLVFWWVYMWILSMSL